MSEEKAVSRRDFLKLAGIAGASVGAAGALGGVLAACGSGTTTTTAAAATTTTAAMATTTTAAGPTTTAAAGETTTTAVATSVETGDPVVIGSIKSLTGDNALTGLEHSWSQKQAATDWNTAKGGVKLSDGKVHPIQLKEVDDQSTDQQAQNAAQQLIKSDNIKIILSSNTTPYNQAAATVCEQNQAFYQIVTSWIDDNGGQAGPNFIGGMHLKWSADVFEMAGKAGLAAVNANKALASGPVTKFAVMVENNPDGIGFGDGTVAGLKAAGWTVPSYEKFVGGQKDFSSIILKFKNAGVEGIVVLISPSDGITFVRQMKQQAWAPKFMFGYKGFWPADFAKTLGADSQFICHDGFWSKDLPFPGCKELGAAFEAAHSGATTNSAGLSYAGAQILFTAIENAGVFEPGAVRDKVFGQTFKGTTIGDVVYGSVYPSDPGIAYWPLLGMQWIDGNRVIVAPPDYATGKTQEFKAWDAR
jgi:ABC-type branched-subunit amino acid transport system substrate-binding protein